MTEREELLGALREAHAFIESLGDTRVGDLLDYVQNNYDIVAGELEAVLARAREEQP